MDPILVITNAGAGTADQETLDRGLAVLREHGSVEVAATGTLGELDSVLHRAGSLDAVTADHPVVDEPPTHRRNAVAQLVVGDPALGFDRLGVVAASLMLFALPTVLFARSMWTVGHAAAQAKRFPPPGKAVVRDTQVLTGAPAVRRARLMQWLSVAVGVLSLALPIALWAFISTLGKTT